MLYSIIVPVYNRPDEVKELLESLSAQTVKPFELVIIEDGSKERCDHLLDHYRSFFAIHYYYKENSGRSETRNYGMERANGDYMLFFDSDVILPPEYFEKLEAAMAEEYCDCFGGPDAADESFSDMQNLQAISAMVRARVRFRAVMPIVSLSESSLLTELSTLFL